MAKALETVLRESSVIDDILATSFHRIAERARRKAVLPRVVPDEQTRQDLINQLQMKLEKLDLEFVTLRVKLLDLQPADEIRHQLTEQLKTADCIQAQAINEQLYLLEPGVKRYEELTRLIEEYPDDMELKNELDNVLQEVESYQKLKRDINFLKKEKRNIVVQLSLLEKYEEYEQQDVAAMIEDYVKLNVNLINLRAISRQRDLNQVEKKELIKLIRDARHKLDLFEGGLPREVLDGIKALMKDRMIYKITPKVVDKYRLLGTKLEKLTRDYNKAVQEDKNKKVITNAKETLELAQKECEKFKASIPPEMFEKLQLLIQESTEIRATYLPPPLEGLTIPSIISNKLKTRSEILEPDVSISNQDFLEYTIAVMIAAQDKEDESTKLAIEKAREYLISINKQTSSLDPAIIIRVIRNSLNHYHNKFPGVYQKAAVIAMRILAIGEEDRLFNE